MSKKSIALLRTETDSHRFEPGSEILFHRRREKLDELLGFKPPIALGR